MKSYIFTIYPQTNVCINNYPFFVGRKPLNEENCLKILDFTVSRNQFVIERTKKGILYKNLSNSTPCEVDGSVITGEILLEESKTYVIHVGSLYLVLGFNYELTKAKAQEISSCLYVVETDDEIISSITEDELLTNCENGFFQPGFKIKRLDNPNNVMLISDIVDFGEKNNLPISPLNNNENGRRVLIDETSIEKGVNFMCPYCRTVSMIEDVLFVSTSPKLLGDNVLGAGEQRRFLATQFTLNGLAIDSEGCVCSEIACPNCHMTIPRALLETSQLVLSVIGAAGAGKSVFLASSIWECRQQLNRKFGVSFMDLDPIANRWINSYEEKLFFQENVEEIQQIEKTDLHSSNVSKSVIIDGDNILLPLPSFFQIRDNKTKDIKSLVVYDSAGEHFRAGGDIYGSAVTLNMINADVLFFMFDPSADPRFKTLINKGTGTAQNYAQRQDILLSEMLARIKRHCGNKGEDKLNKPLIIGISKADLLRDYLPLEEEVYKVIDKNIYGLDYKVLRKMSNKIEEFMIEIVPEVIETVHAIANDVWFMPVSSLGHNPKKEGVRPKEIKPIFVELPFVFMLAEQGLIKKID